MYKIFVDGQHGTTGLEIHRLLHARTEFTLLALSEADKKNADARRACLNDADAVVLCLPDEAAKEAVAMIQSPKVHVLDASTAHRVHPQWQFGMPELHRGEGRLRAHLHGAKRVSNPGCYSTGFLFAVEPLIHAGLLPATVALSVHAISGYSGGGRQMIEKFQARATSAQTPDQLFHGQAYALTLEHKHVPEMHAHSGTITAPLFAPSVGHFYRGMLVNIPLFAKDLRGSPASNIQSTIVDLWRTAYANEPCIRVFDAGAAHALNDGQLNGYLDPQGANHTNRVELMAFGNRERVLLVARLDNLGKGAAGAAVQNLNLMLGLPEFTGLPL